jgi:O-antigen/teichoic acid export membrane protein
MIIQPIAFIAVVAGFHWQFPEKLNPALVMGIYVATTFVFSLGLGAWQLRVAVRSPIEKAQTQNQVKIWLKSTVPFLVLGMVTVADSRISTVLLGALSSKADVAIFGVLTRAVDLLTLVVLAFSQPIGRIGLQYYLENNQFKLQSLIARATRIMTLIGWLLGILLILFGKWYLLIFGTDYLIGYSALILLTLAEMVNIATGICNYLLTITNHEKVTAQVVLISLALNIFLGLMLIPRFGLQGAAIAEMSSVIIQNILLSIMTKKLIGIDPTILSRLPAKPSAENP